MRRSTYRAITSSSRFTVARLDSRVVRSSVSGMSETSKPSSVRRGDRQADSVHRDRPCSTTSGGARAGQHHAQPPREPVLARIRDLGPAVDVALDEVAAERIAGPERRLEVHRSPALERSPSVVTSSVWFMTSASKRAVRRAPRR